MMATPQATNSEGVIVVTIPGGAGSVMGKFCAIAGADPGGGLKWWYPAVIAQSTGWTSSWSGITNEMYGSEELSYAQDLAYKNTGDSNAQLDVGEIVGLPAGLGPCGGVDIGLICTNVPAQDTLTVVSPPAGWGNVIHSGQVCGFTTC